MNEVYIDTTTLPVLYGCGFCAAAESFYHIDRTADFNVCIYVIEGAIYVSEGDADYELTPGCLLFLKSGVRHFGKKPCPAGSRWFYAHFFTEERELPPYTAGGEIPAFTQLRFRSPLPKLLTGLSGSRFDGDIRKFAEYCASSDSNVKWYANLRFFELLSSLCLTEQRPATLSQKIALYLKENCCKPFSAADLQREFFLSYKRLAAVFKAETGQTMQQYHLEMQMSQACRLLRSTLLSIGEIAERVGYSDPLYFSKRFKAHTGLSPKEYRHRGTLDYSGNSFGGCGI